MAGCARGRLYLLPFVCILASASARAVPSSSVQVGLDRPIIREHIEAGRYEEAEAVAERVVASLGELSRDATPADLDVYNLLIETRWLSGRNTVATWNLAEALIDLVRVGVPPETNLLAASLRNLGRVRMLAGSYAEAVTTFEQVVELEQLRSGPHDPAVADALNDLAGALLTLDRHDDAQRAIERALAIRNERLGREPIELAGVLESFSLLLQRRGAYTEAAAPLERALAIRKRLQPEHPDLARTFWLSGTLAGFEGQVSSARDRHAEALALAERTLRASHPAIALYAHWLASSLALQGDLTRALSLRTRATSIAETSLGADHPEFAGYLNDLANTYYLQGDYPAARGIYERALRITERRLGASHQSVATRLFNLALVNHQLGNLAEARAHYSRAVSIWRSSLGPAHPFVATALGGLAEVARTERRYGEARQLLEDALSIRERALGATHPNIASTLLNLAETVEAVGRLNEAEKLAARAVAISEEVGSASSPALAKALTIHGRLVASLGNPAAAQVSYERALTIRERVGGPSHPETTAVNARLAEILARNGEPARAATTALRAEQADREHVRLTLRYLPEREAIGYASRRARPLDVGLSLSDRFPDPTIAVRLLDAVIRGRALVLDEMSERRRSVTDETRADLSPRWTAVVSARQRLANLAVRGPSEARPGQYLGLLNEARRDKELAERALADLSASFAAELADIDVGLEQVRAVLPSGAAIVSYVRYERLGVGTEAPLRTTPHYVAFIFRADEPAPHIVQLGPAGPLESAVTQWHREASSGPSRAGAERMYRPTGARLRQLAWDPIATHLKGTTRVFVVPDGALNLVNLAALPVGDAEYLIDRDQVIHGLSAERDLVPFRARARIGRGLLALGGASFDAGSTSRPAETALRGAAANCPSLRSLRFASLPGTLREASQISELWSAYDRVRGEPIELLSGERASERAFKDLAPGSRVLHLATHGFFLGGACVPSAAGTRAVGGLSAAAAPPPRALAVDNPLLLAGLALSGANRRATASRDGEDGILTAEEIGALDLSGVEWAVLSACDTGLGEVRNGEGVFGLRRAFQVAGVRTVVMSLWSVEDEATRRWMRALYEGRLERRLDTAAAVWEASRSVLGERRLARQSTHPFYWAAFVAAGDWR